MGYRIEIYGNLIGTLLHSPIFVGLAILTNNVEVDMNLHEVLCELICDKRVLGATC